MIQRGIVTTIIMAIIRNCKTAEASLLLSSMRSQNEEDAQALQEHLQGCPDCLARLAMARTNRRRY